ncbi:hypothetical protein Tco_1543957, partial [Tanacetum coccineum]
MMEMRCSLGIFSQVLKKLPRVQEGDGYDANQVKIELFSPEVKVVSIVEFLHGAINRTVGGITFQESDIEELKSNWQFTRLSLRWPESVE